MTKNEEKVIGIFASNNQTILLYNKLRKDGYDVALLSAPNKFSVGCTKAIKFNISDIDIVKEEIKKNKLLCEGMYRRVISDNKITYVLIS